MGECFRMMNWKWRNKVVGAYLIYYPSICLLRLKVAMKNASYYANRH